MHNVFPFYLLNNVIFHKKGTHILASKENKWQKQQISIHPLTFKMKCVAKNIFFLEQHEEIPFAFCLNRKHSTHVHGNIQINWCFNKNGIIIIWKRRHKIFPTFFKQNILKFDSNRQKISIRTNASKHPYDW